MCPLLCLTSVHKLKFFARFDDCEKKIAVKETIPFYSISFFFSKSYHEFAIFNLISTHFVSVCVIVRNDSTGTFCFVI